MAKGIDFGKVEKKRVALGMTVEDAAAKIGMAKQQWSNMRRHPNVRVETLRKLGDVLQCPPCDLLMPAAKPKPNRGAK